MQKNKNLEPHLELIAEGGTYAGYFSQGTNESGVESAYYITDDPNKAAADVSLDAKVAELTAEDIGSATAGGEGGGDSQDTQRSYYDDPASEQTTEHGL